jgi:hypothetical protein
MATKVGIIEQIGASGLFLPELINRGLVARDRLKYYLALLQSAHLFAQSPNHPAPNAERRKREASGFGPGRPDRPAASHGVASSVPAQNHSREHLRRSATNHQPLRAAASQPECKSA